jgi:hypothetical protein
MKSFKEYLTESKKVYEFKVKVAGDCPKDCTSLVKAALSEFNVSSVSAPRRTPIQEHHSEFPEHKNIHMTIIDVTTDYPATSLQIRERVASGLGLAQSSVKVKSMFEEREHAINHANDETTGEAILGVDYEASDNQDLVGEKRKLNFLQELNKEKHQGTEYTGVNDQLLAKGQPKHVKETPAKQVESKTKFVNLFTKTKHVDPVKGVK